MPLPTLVRAGPVPDPLITPEYVVLVASPTVRLPVPSVTLPPVEPPPESEPIARLKLFRSSLTPAALTSVMAVDVDRALLVPAWSVPAEMFVGARIGARSGERKRSGAVLVQDAAGPGAADDAGIGHVGCVV